MKFNYCFRWLSFCLILGPTLPAQDQTRLDNLRPRNVVAKPATISIQPKAHVAGLFTVKFVEGSHIRLSGQQLVLDSKLASGYRDEVTRLKRAGLTLDQATEETAAINKLLQTYREKYGFSINYLFSNTSKQQTPEDQFKEKEELEQKNNEELADLNLYYIVFAKDFKDAAIQQQFMNAINKFRIVEATSPAVLAEGAYLKSGDNADANLNVNATTPTADISGRQGYLNAAPSGIDARYAWTVRGGMGDDVQVIDIEYDWVTDHEDFPRNRYWGGRSVCPYDGSGTEHGTAVMGVLASPHNGFGISGITPNIRYGLSSACRPFDVFAAGAIAAFSGENFTGRAHNVLVAHAIFDALSGMRPGDVILIEQHTFGPEEEWVPMEYYQECFDVVRRATAANIIVVEAAGNGGRNLDASGYSNRFQRSFRNSNALMVGACNDGDREAAGFTNFGTRVDVHGWGVGVVSIGYRRGEGEPFTNTPINRYYTCCFGGTSSASPIVTGAVASIQGARKAAGLPVLNPHQMRDLVISTGTAQADATRATRPIGPLPNLRNALTTTLGSPVSFDPGALYKLVNVNSSKAMEVRDYSRVNGGEICQWEFHGGDNQLWRIVSAGGGYFYIRSVLNNKNLEVYEFSTSNGGRLAQWDHTGANNQQWRIERQPDGSYMLVNRHSNKVAEVYGLSRDNFASIVHWDSWNGANQKFRIERVR